MCVVWCGIYVYVCLQTLSPPGPRNGTGFFSVPSGPSFPAVSGVNRLAPAVSRCPWPGNDHCKLEGCHKAVPGCASPRGLGSGDWRRVPAATRAGRAPRAAGRGPGRRARLPRDWAAATRQERRVLLPAGQRLAWPPGFVTALVPAREAPGRRVPGGLCVQGSPTLARPSCERLRVPAGAPGAGLARWARTRLGYGTGEVWGRGASGDRAAPHGRVWGRWLVSAWGLRDAVGIRVPALCPPTRSGRRVTFARRRNMVGAERQPPLPLRPAGPALWASDAGRGQSRCPASPRRSALGAGSLERPGKPSGELRARAPRTLSAGPRVSDRLPPSSPGSLGAGKGRRLAASAASQDCARAPGYHAGGTDAHAPVAGGADKFKYDTRAKVAEQGKEDFPDPLDACS
ncbi:interferon regulatory factor 2 isoform X1 [Arvicanthis niloticus]|uniref:interferon regulatory factor 2 isoform X1 n=1 Tax=Arvicanthis niloticus TaxID=61156 RepID=UPI00402BCC26